MNSSLTTSADSFLLLAKQDVRAVASSELDVNSRQSFFLQARHWLWCIALTGAETSMSHIVFRLEVTLCPRSSNKITAAFLVRMFLIVSCKETVCPCVPYVPICAHVCAACCRGGCQVTTWPLQGCLGSQVQSDPLIFVSVPPHSTAFNISQLATKTSTDQKVSTFINQSIYIYRATSMKSSSKFRCFSSSPALFFNTTQHGIQLAALRFEQASGLKEGSMDQRLWSGLKMLKKPKV